MLHPCQRPRRALAALCASFLTGEDQTCQNDGTTVAIGQLSRLTTICPTPAHRSMGIPGEAASISTSTGSRTFVPSPSQLPSMESWSQPAGASEKAGPGPAWLAWPAGGGSSEERDAKKGAGPTKETKIIPSKFSLPTPAHALQALATATTTIEPPIRHCLFVPSLPDLVACPEGAFVPASPISTAAGTSLFPPSTPLHSRSPPAGVGSVFFSLPTSPCCCTCTRCTHWPPCDSPSISLQIWPGRRILPLRLPKRVDLKHHHLQLPLNFTRARYPHHATSKHQAPTAPPAAPADDTSRCVSQQLSVALQSQSQTQTSRQRQT